MGLHRNNILGIWKWLSITFISTKCTFGTAPCFTLCNFRCFALSLHGMLLWQHFSNQTHVHISSVYFQMVSNSSNLRSYARCKNHKQNQKACWLRIGIHKLSWVSNQQFHLSATTVLQTHTITLQSPHASIPNTTRSEQHCALHIITSVNLIIFEISSILMKFSIKYNYHSFYRISIWNSH